MGLFSTNYNKPGPGVSKNERKRKGLFLYIEIVVRKFLKLMQANFLYTLVSLPFLIALFLFISRIIAPLAFRAFTTLDIRSVTSEEEQLNIMHVYIWFCSTLSLLIFNFIGFAPVSVAYAFITRCFTRGEHVWIWSDGKDIFKENIKQSFLIFLLDIAFVVFGVSAVLIYSINYKYNVNGMGNVFFMLMCFMYVILAVYMFMHYYIYQIMVTYECKTKELLKSSLIFAIGKLPMSILLTVICGGIFILGAYYVGDNPFAFALVYSIIGLTFTRYPMEFYASRVIDKNIKIENKKKENKKARINYIEE